MQVVPVHLALFFAQIVPSEKQAIYSAHNGGVAGERRLCTNFSGLLDSDIVTHVRKREYHGF